MPPVELPILQARAATAEIAAALDALASQPALCTGLDLIPLPILVLNLHRQIIFANRALCDRLAIPDQHSLSGHRLGELLRCQTALQANSGCGTGIACRLCGALRAVRFSQQEAQTTQRECQLELDVGGRIQSWATEITAAPLAVEGRVFTLVTLRDLGDRMRRQQLERACLDHALGRAEVLHNLATAVGKGVRQAGMDHEYRRLAMDEARRLADHLRFHHHLSAAEQGALTPTISTVTMVGLAQEAVGDLGSQAHRIRYAELPDRIMATDAFLLRCVLTRLLLNACEAAPGGGDITLTGTAQERGVSLAIRNPGEVSPLVRMQLFHRICSTKDVPGHGISTYAARLFIEDLLGGHIRIDSHAGFTTVSIDLPDSPLNQSTTAISATAPATCR
jgi:signal transduction histidine kinase